MSIVGGVVTFFILWWLILFMVLPWRVQRQEDPAPGHEVGAPENPRILLKMAVTTGITLVVFAGVWWFVDAGLISFRE